MSKITTHILDTSIGQQAVGVSIQLQKKRIMFGNNWQKELQMRMG